MPMSEPINLSGAIDLGAAMEAQQNVPPEQKPAFDCLVEDGCGLRVRGDRAHETLIDCLNTTVPYVQFFMESEAALIQVNNYAVDLERKYFNLQRQAQDILDANHGLATEKERLAGELREARRGTPLAKKAVLEGAENLAAAMKKGPEVHEF